MKSNLRHRVVKLLLLRRSVSSWWRTLHARIKHLATAMQSVRDACWNERHKDDRAWDDFFGTGVLGPIDSYPIMCRRPKDRVWRKGMYQGKYKQFILKVQVVVDETGLPLWWSGPHAGVIADITLWRNHRPALEADDMLIGDKAYQGADDIISPFKRPRGGHLTEDQKDYNLIHS
jgi:hypothetical protein